MKLPSATSSVFASKFAIVLVGVFTHVLPTFAIPANFTNISSLQKRNPGGLKIHLKASYQQKQYLLNVQVAQDIQEYTVLVDTGSSKLWLLSELLEKPQKETFEDPKTNIPLYRPGPNWKASLQEGGSKNSANTFKISYGGDEGLEVPGISGLKGLDEVTLLSPERWQNSLVTSNKKDVQQQIKSSMINIGAATRLSPDWTVNYYKARRLQGVLGLSFGRRESWIPFQETLGDRLAAPVMTFKLPFEKPGDIRFGYEDTNDYISDASELQQSRNVHDYFWALDSIFYYRSKIDKEKTIKETYHFLVDTGAYELILPELYLSAIYHLLKEANLQPEVTYQEATEISSLAIPCSKRKALAESSLRWKFNLGKAVISMSDYVKNTYIDLKYLNQQPWDESGFDIGGVEYCGLLVETRPEGSIYVLGVPFFNTHWVSLSQTGTIRWAPQRYADQPGEQPTVPTGQRPQLPNMPVT